MNCFPFDVTVFAMLPAHGIWRETVALIVNKMSCDHELANEWACCGAKNASYLTIRPVARKVYLLKKTKEKPANFATR